ncbi:MAG: hypothetical protein Q9220_003364 [cf. Caloplaca sp. 1 TL-2023]
MGHTGANDQDLVLLVAGGITMFASTVATPMERLKRPPGRFGILGGRELIGQPALQWHGRRTNGATGGSYGLQDASNPARVQA